MFVTTFKALIPHCRSGTYVFWGNSSLLPALSNVSRCFSSGKKTGPVVFGEAMENYIQNTKKQYEDMSAKLSTGNVDHVAMAKMGKEMARLAPILKVVEEREKEKKNAEDLKQLEKEELSKGVDGQEMATLAQQERSECEEKIVKLEEELIRLLVPKDEDDDKGIILEVRSGTGGEEAGLFAQEILKMYQRLCSEKGWSWELMSLSKTQEFAGLKEAQAAIRGIDVYKYLKFESGVHRVQRIPVNDVKIQTSAASVVVLPEVEEMDFDIRQEDIRVDVYRAGGAGGQSVNKTESAVRMTHIPTGITVAIQDERSQLQNRAKALRYLRARVYDFEKSKADKARSEMRSATNSTGDRSDKIRTYNFPQDRVTDHRVPITVNSVERVLSGEYLPIISDALVEMEEKDRITNFLENISNRN